MATSSPALSNNSTDTTPNPNPNPNPPIITTNSPAALAALTTTNTSKNLRGLNKPKCIKCGNVARSRCPYQSCKSCCAKAQNPCHIHVLKGSSTIPDKAPSNGSPSLVQQSKDASPAGNSHRVASFRQLSNNFAQFNNLQIRSRKPLTRKEAGVINEWRYLKLKEYKDRNIEAENEAFDRYMQNVSLIEEVFAMNSALPIKDDGSPGPTSNLDPASAKDGSEMGMAEMRLNLRSNPTRAENIRNKIQHIVDQGLRKLKKFELNDGGATDLSEQELVRRSKKKKSRWAERADALTDLIDKLNKARNEDDLKSCLEMKAQIFNRHGKTSEVEECQDIVAPKEPTPQKNTSLKLLPDYSPPKLFSTTTVDQEALNRVDSHFASLEEIDEL